MCCTPDKVMFKCNGEYTYVQETDCPIVRHWASKYNAKKKIEYTQENGTSHIHDHGWDAPVSIVPVPEYKIKESKNVWAVPCSRMGASHDAHLIKRLVSAASLKEYGEIRQRLLRSGYPDNVLDAVPSPEQKQSGGKASV